MSTFTFTKLKNLVAAAAAAAAAVAFFRRGQLGCQILCAAAAASGGLVQCSAVRDLPGISRHHRCLIITDAKRPRRRQCAPVFAHIHHRSTSAGNNNIKQSDIFVDDGGCVFFDTWCRVRAHVQQQQRQVKSRNVHRRGLQPSCLFFYFLLQIFAFAQNLHPLQADATEIGLLSAICLISSGERRGEVVNERRCLFAKLHSILVIFLLTDGKIINVISPGIIRAVIKRVRLLVCC